MKGQMLKLFVIVTLCLSIVAGCVASPAPAPMQPTTTPVPPTPTPLDVVQKYQDAYARHDMDAAMSLFTDDVKYAWGEYFTTTDRTMIRNWLEYDAALNVQTTVNNCKPTDSTVTCEWRFVNDCFGANGTGSNDMNGVIVFTVREGMISDFLYTDNPNPAEGQWEEAFFTWLAATYPTEPVLETLAAKKFDRNFGQHLDKLCKEYWEGKKATTSTLSPAVPVKAWVDALKSGDVDAMLALFTDDAQYRLFFDATGQEGLRGVFNWLVGLKANNAIGNCQQTQSDRVMCDLTVVDDCIAAFGAPEGLAAKGTYIFREDGKIQQVAGAQEGAGWDGYWKWVDEMFAWQRTNRAEESAKADYSLGKDGGAVQIKLCKEYAESLKSATTTTSDNKDATGAALGDLKLTILYDNTAVDTQLKSDWGFAALVEYGGHTLLFDTGADGSMLLDNMRQLDVDPKSIEAVIFSHEHGDHTGGLQALLETGVRPTVYAPAAFSSAFKDQVRARTELVEVTDPLEILPGLHLTRPTGSIIEQALVVETRDGTAVITGCAHPGVANMVRQAQEVVPGKVPLLAGGFHLLEIADKDELQSIIAELRQLGVERILPTHCTGDGAIDLFRTEFGENYLDGGVGRTVASSAAGRAALPAPAPTPLPTAVGTGGAGDPSTVVQAYHAAISSGDVDAALSLLTDDAKLRGVYYGTGKEALPWIFDWLVGQETKYGPADCQTQDERVVCAFTVSDACIAAYGATGGLPWKGAYVIGQDGKIQEASESKEGTSWDDYDKWARTVDTWIANNRADELPADGMNKETAVVLAKFCKEYAASLK